jgi:myo-inositol-1(or 4)-monophosphatase
MEKLEKLTFDVCTLARSIGEFLRSERKGFSQSRVKIKGLNNFVSDVDKNAEQQIVDSLRSMLPEAGFIAEEGTATCSNERYRWVVDPLDGTTNFIHGLAPYAVSIALMDGDEVILGVVHEAVANECFYAWKGSKSFLDGHEIHVSEVATVESALVATGFPYYNFEKIQRYMNSLAFFMQRSHGMRRLGSAATDLAYVACGRFEAFYEYSLQPWDVAAGSLIVKQAGGRISDFSGGNAYIFGQEMVSTNAKIYEEFLEIVRKHF